MTEEIKDEGQVPEHGPGSKCPHCLKREKEQEEAEELSLAILIALVPALTITLFANMGLF